METIFILLTFCFTNALMLYIGYCAGSGTVKEKVIDPLIKVPNTLLKKVLPVKKHEPIYMSDKELYEQELTEEEEGNQLISKGLEKLRNQHKE